MNSVRDGATISVAMATYNGARHIRAQLASLSAQNRLPDELVVCDDGSTDDTVALVEQFAERAPFAVNVRCNRERLGYNGNFAQAITRTTGEIIFICDQDDIWFADKIAVGAASLAANPGLLAVINDQIIADADAEPTNSTVLQNIRRLGYPDTYFIPGCCTAFRRALLDIALPIPGDAVPYDHWLNTIADQLGARQVCEQPLQLYRRHESNASGSAWAHERPSALTLVASARGKDACSEFKEKVKSLKLLGDRLGDRRDVIETLGLGHRRSEAEASVARERDDYQRRIDALGRGRLGRIAKVAGMLANGSYRRFQGYKSALKDIVT